MSSINIDITILDLVLMALTAGAPGLVIGIIAGALLWPRRRIVRAILGGVLGFFISIGAVWVFFIR